MSDDSNECDRRRFLEWASAIGLASVAPSTVSEIAEAKRTRRGPEDLPPDERPEVHHTHVTEIPTVQQQLDRYEQTGDPTVLYNPELERHLGERPDKREFDLIVQTVGQRSVVDSKGPAERTIHGWRPSREEVDRLSTFGEVGFVPKFVSTTVSLRGVDRDDIGSIARLPFVVEVNWDPPIVPENDVDDLRGSSYFRFTAIENDVSIPSWLKIGILDTGYQGDGHGRFAESHAEDIGLDETLANDFTGDDDWRDPSYGSQHGDDVADMCAYMLQDGHDDLFVPLKVVGSDTRDNTREAIEYAEENAIRIINMSLGTEGPQDTCPSVYCSALRSYVQAGYFPVASAGNDGSTSGTTFPGGEWLTIGAGGIDGDCSGDEDYERDSRSNYGHILYNDPTVPEVHCHYCYNEGDVYVEFMPHAYGSYVNDTDDDVTIEGTSFASPQLAAAAAVMRSNYLTDYDQLESIFRNMDTYQICPTDAADEGQLLDAKHAYDETD